MAFSPSESNIILNNSNRIFNEKKSEERALLAISNHVPSYMKVERSLSEIRALKNALSLISHPLATAFS